jgi:hypothetical protein
VAQGVGDVTLIGGGPSGKRDKRGKRLINSNVALEVGYPIVHNTDEVQFMGGVSIMTELTGWHLRRDTMGTLHRDFPDAFRHVFGLMFRRGVLDHPEYRRKPGRMVGSILAECGSESK